MCMGLFSTTEDMKKVQLPQQNEMLSLCCTALGFISKNEEYKLENNKLIKFESNSNHEKCV